jgi:regulator of RNase E activity RraB
MRDNSVLYFLFFLLALVTYNLYKESQDNERLYKICTDQEDTIQLQSKAINSQKVYISQLQYSYNNLYYGKGASYDNPNTPIH